MVSPPRLNIVWPLYPGSCIEELLRFMEICPLCTQVHRDLVCVASPPRSRSLASPCTQVQEFSLSTQVEFGLSAQVRRVLSSPSRFRSLASPPKFRSLASPPRLPLHPGLGVWHLHPRSCIQEFDLSTQVQLASPPRLTFKYKEFDLSTQVHALGVASLSAFACLLLS